ncbi:MAG TPA: hypothetical protein VJ716_04570 [Gaiellaceae bacterium]|nr:hypothetical protein [Gaiellaceae bacterium]
MLLDADDGNAAAVLAADSSGPLPEPLELDAIALGYVFRCCGCHALVCSSGSSSVKLATFYACPRTEGEGRLMAEPPFDPSDGHGERVGVDHARRSGGLGVTFRVTPSAPSRPSRFSAWRAIEIADE